MKKLYIALISIVFIFAISSHVQGKQNIYKVKNSREDIYAIDHETIDGELYLPVRSTCELLGYDVYWIKKNKNVKIIGPEADYTIKVDSLLCETNKKLITMKNSPVIIGNRTYAPFVFFTQIMDLEYDKEMTLLKTDINSKANSIRIENYVNEYRIMKDLRLIAKDERLAGTQGENEIKEMLYSRFSNAGFDVKLQPFKIYKDYTKVIPDINRLHIMGTLGGIYDTSVVVNSKNGNVKGELVWYEDTENYKDKIVILDTYDYKFYEYLNAAVKKGALAVVMLGEAYENLMYGLYEEDKIIAIGVDRSKMKELRELLNNNIKVYAQVNVQNGSWSKESFNVIAKKQSKDNPNNEILIVTSHYDSKAGSTGANDNASGISIMMEVAENFSSYPSDMDIWFVALGANKQELAGSKYFMSRLDEETKKKIVGCLNLDKLADKNGNHFNIYTVDGRKNIISYFLERSFYKLYGESLPVKNDIIGDHSTFSYAGIPSVMLSQDRVNIGYYVKDDTIDNIDINHLGKTARVISNALNNMVSKATPSILELQKGYNIANDNVHNLSIKALFPFGKSINTVEREMGIKGYAVPSSNGMARLKYNIKWFENIIVPSYFIYDDYGNLRYIEINFNDGEITEDKTLNVLEDALGDPEVISFDTLGWKSIYGNYYSYNDNENCMYIYPYAPEDKIIRNYQVAEGKIVTNNNQHQELWDILSGLMRRDDIDRITGFSIFTDFLGNKTGFIKRDSPEQIKDGKGEFVFNLDYNDIFNKSGSFRNYEKTIKVLVHEYGHLLTLNKTQVDLKSTEERPIGYNGGKFIKGSYLDTFYNEFWKDNIEYWDNMVMNDYYKRFNDRFVSKYGATKASEDICESFVAFIFNDSPPEGKTIAEEKILFFYNYDEMNNIRDHIRSYLQLDET